MANDTVTVKASGGDYTDPQTALDAADVSSGWFKVVLDDDSTYNNGVPIDIDTTTGTPTASNYVWFTASSGNRVEGVTGSGHAKLEGGSPFSGDAALEVAKSYTHVEHMDIRMIAIGTSKEAIRVTSAAPDGVIISRCVLWAGTSGSTQQDGIYVGAWDINSLYIDHCVLYGWGRHGIHLQQFQGSGNYSQTVYVDYCAFYDCAAVGIRNSETGETSRVHLYNCVADASTFDLMVENSEGSGGNGTTRVDGSHNATNSTSTDVDTLIDTDNTTDWVYFGNGITTTTTTSDAWIVTSTTYASLDLTPKEATGGGSNDILGAGTNRTAPESRQDFSVDVAYNSRPSSDIDIGPFQITSGGGSGVPAGRKPIRNMLVR